MSPEDSLRFKMDIAFKGRESQVKAEPSSGRIFFLIPLSIILLTAALCVYETLAQQHTPDQSILAVLHKNGYLLTVPIVYQPSKGIWLYMGWAGATMMVLMLLYSVRKRMSLLRPLGRLPQWLSLHMFLGIMGPMLITFHTTFKFGGIIATSYFCMMATMISGLLGRYLYVQIPRSISGTELQVQDIDRMVEDFDRELNQFTGGMNVSNFLKAVALDPGRTASSNPFSSLYQMIRTDLTNFFIIFSVKSALERDYHLDREAVRKIALMLKKKAELVRRKHFLAASHSLLHYWHVFHLPLSIVMFVIMFLHIGVYYLFRPVH
jgi:hypothetical protein